MVGPLNEATVTVNAVLVATDKGRQSRRHYWTTFLDISRNGVLWVTSPSYRRFRRACQDHFGRGPAFFAVFIQTAVFCLVLITTGALVDRNLPYQAHLFDWAREFGVGLTETPNNLVRSTLAFLLTGLPLFTAVMTFVISGSRQSYLSMELLQNPRLRMLLVWFGITVLYGLFLSYGARTTEQHDWLLSSYLYVLCVLRTLYLSLVFLSQQLSRTSLSKDMMSCVTGIEKWSSLLREDLRPFTAHVVTCAQDHIDGAAQILHAFLRLNMHTEYRESYHKFNPQVATFVMSLARVKWIDTHPTAVRTTDLRNALRFLMTRYSYLIAVQAEPNVTLAKTMAENAVGHLDLLSNADQHRDRDQLLPVYGLAGLRSAISSYLKHQRYTHLSHLLSTIAQMGALSGNPYAQVATIRLFQWVLLKAAVAEDRPAINEILYRMRDLAGRPDLDHDVRLHLYQVIMGVIVKTIEHSHQSACGTLLKTFVSNFSPALANQALEALIKLSPGAPIEYKFPADDENRQRLVRSEIAEIALPISFAPTRKTVHYCLLKFVVLLYAQQKYVLDRKANFNPDLTTPLWPNGIPEEYEADQRLDYIMSKLRAARYPLLFLKDDGFMIDLKRDVEQQLGISPPDNDANSASELQDVTGDDTVTLPAPLPPPIPDGWYPTRCTRGQVFWGEGEYYNPRLSCARRRCATLGIQLTGAELCIRSGAALHSPSVGHQTDARPNEPSTVEAKPKRPLH